MKKLITTCAFLMLVSGIFAATFTVGGIAYNTTSANSVEVTSKTPIYTSSITIPSTVDNLGETYNVTSIGVHAFQFCTGLTSVTIPSSVTSIGQGAFFRCTGLTSITITIPSSVTSIGSQAFGNCTHLTSITIPSSVTSIGSQAFGGCSLLTSINVNVDNANYSSTDGVLFNKDKTTIVCYPGGGQAVYTIPSSVTSIGDYAFENCSGLTSITIPSSVTSIGDWAFYLCTGLTSITIPSFVTSIGKYAFESCSGLTSVNIQGSVTSIGDGVFQNCIVLASITIPNSVTSIGNSVFNNCINLSSISIPSSVTSIGDQAFQDCNGLTAITIPSSVTSIGDNAFMFSGLTTLTCLRSTPPTLGFYCFDFTTITDVFVPTDAAVIAYKANADWGAAFPGDLIIKKVIISSVSDGNWNVGTNWSVGVVPTTDQAVVIANIISLDVNESVSDLTINSGSVLNVNAGKQLTVSSTFTNNGTLNLLSTAADGTATILTPATISGSGTTNVQQFLTGKTGDTKTDNWWYISSPVTGATSAIFNPASILTDKNLFGYYNEPTVAYPQITTNVVTLTAGTGYVVKLGGATGSSATYAFTGTLNDGDIPVTVTRTGNDAGKRGFNLVGNPYPSYLDWNAVKVAATNPTNVRPTIWYRTRTSGGAMTFDTFDGATGTNNGANGMVSQYIPPMQAFWMKVDADNSSATLTFANNMRSHKDQSSTTNRLRAANVNSAQIVRLKVSNGINSDAAIVVADPNALDGFDNYDSQKMSNGDVNIPEIYTLAGSEELVINHLNAINADKELTLGFRPGKTGDFTIEATEISNLDNNLKVMLLDKQTNTQQEIKVGSPYSFSSDATATNNRFSVLFKASSSPTGLDNSSSNGDVTVYRNTANHVTVECNANVNEKSLVSVYNAVGQRLIQQKLTGKFTEINNTFMPGIYIVSVNNGGQSVTKKIIIN